MRFRWSSQKKLGGGGARRAVAPKHPKSTLTAQATLNIAKPPTTMHPEPPNSGSIRTYRQENGRGRVVFNTFPMPFRAFGNALSVSIAFPLWGRPRNVQSVSNASAFRLL